MTNSRLRDCAIARFVVVILILGETEVFAQKPPELSRRERKDRVAALSQEYRDFLNLVDPIITPEELHGFLLMESDAQRDRFIDDFWRRRDPDPRTVANEYREDYLVRYEEAKKLFRSVNSDQGRIYLLAGEPMQQIENEHCGYLKPISVWRYLNHHSLGSRVTLIFYDRGASNYDLWRPQGNLNLALRELLSLNADTAVQNRYFCLGSPGFRVDPVQAIFYGAFNCKGVLQRPLIHECKGGEEIIAAVRDAENDRAGVRISRIFEPPKVETEDLGRVLRASVIANPDAPKIVGDTSVRYGGRRGERTGALITLDINPETLKAADAAGVKTFSLDVAGETMKDQKVFETFQYRFNVLSGVTVPRIAVERHLFPGDYIVRLKVTDPNSGAEGIFEVPLKVPDPDDPAVVAASEPTPDQPKLRILPIGDEGLITGSARVETIVNYEPVRAVEFYLDGKKLLTKRSAPYSVSLDFGPVPRTRLVRVTLLGMDGEVVDADEIVVNAGADPFRVRIASPRNGAKATGNVRVEVEPRVPAGQTLKQVEIFVNDNRAATLYAPPFVQTVNLGSDPGIATIRAVATLSDAAVTPAEAVVFVNAPDYMQQIEVRLIEVPVTVTRDGRPVSDLPQSAFRVVDAGKPVKIERFEYIRNLPLSIGLVIDTSGSMRDRLGEVQSAAALFLRNVMKSGDKAFIMSFDRHPQLLRRWSSNPNELAAGLSAMRAEEMTALHDAVITALYEFHGLRGQRALVLLSDGRDTASKFEFEQAIEYARRAGVPIYAIGVGLRSVDIDARPRLTKLATETGGNVYFLSGASELPGIYKQIESELRSQYLLAFTPAPAKGDEWRELRVEVAGATAKSIRGYYP